MAIATYTDHTAEELAQLHRKVDRLTLLLEAQEKRQRAFEELKDDAVPIVNHAIKITIDELAEVGNDFSLEDLFYLLKRVLRNTDLILKMMDQLEALSSLMDEAELLGPQVFHQAVITLDEMERKGYFKFAQGGLYVTEQIVTEFDEQDVRALGDNIVTILKTVRHMTQPEIMALADKAIGAVEEPVDEVPSTLSLLKQLNDPSVRRGLARTLNMLKSISDDPGGNLGRN